MKRSVKILLSALAVAAVAYSAWPLPSAQLQKAQPASLTPDQVIAIVKAYFATNTLSTAQIITPVIVTHGITNQ